MGCIFMKGVIKIMGKSISVRYIGEEYVGELEEEMSFEQKEKTLRLLREELMSLEVEKRFFIVRVGKIKFICMPSPFKDHSKYILINSISSEKVSFTELGVAVRPSSFILKDLLEIFESSDQDSSEVVEIERGISRKSFSEFELKKVSDYFNQSLLDRPVTMGWFLILGNLALESIPI